MLVTKALVGSHPVAVEHERKSSQLTAEQLRQARSRLRWYEQRDQDKIKRDVAMNGFESMIYKLREWLREDDNAPYVPEAKREQLLAYLGEQEDWLYDEGANANHTVFQSLEKNLTTQHASFEKRKEEHQKREIV